MRGFARFREAPEALGGLAIDASAVAASPEDHDPAPKPKFPQERADQFSGESPVICEKQKRAEDRYGKRGNEATSVLPQVIRMRAGSQRARIAWRRERSRTQADWSPESVQFSRTIKRSPPAGRSRRPAQTPREPSKATRAAAGISSRWRRNFELPARRAPATKRKRLKQQAI